MFLSFKKYHKEKKKSLATREEKYIRSIRQSMNFCGENLEIFGKIELAFPQNICIGNNCKLNEGVYLNARSGITIGNNVTISPYVKIISTGYDINRWVSTGERIHVTDQPIEVGSNCWICAGAIILPGVKITGEYVIVGAGSVVSNDINESHVVVAGVPARIVKKLKL